MFRCGWMGHPTLLFSGHSKLLTYFRLLSHHHNPVDADSIVINDLLLKIVPILSQFIEGREGLKKQG